MKMINCLAQAVLTVIICCTIGSTDAQDLQADNMLMFQRENGGWHKQLREKAINYNNVFTDADKADIAAEVKEGWSTIDNGATNKEIAYLVHIYKTVPNPKYLAAAEKGIRYLLKAQYANGGFPQYYPDHGMYRNEITYNDYAMINCLNTLRNVALHQNGFDIVDQKLVVPCAEAVAKGVDCILKTQIVANGKLTAWCQQYDEKTLEPAKARAYELPSISGNESVGIVEFLINEQKQTPEIKRAVTAAVEWFNTVKITGYRFATDIPDDKAPEGKDRRLVPDANSTVWARFYEIGTNRPFFCDRDGIKKYDLRELSYERRDNYGWYGSWPQKLLEVDYPEWLKKQK